MKIAVEPFDFHNVYNQAVVTFFQMAHGPDGPLRSPERQVSSNCSSRGRHIGFLSLIKFLSRNLVFLLPGKQDGRSEL